MYDNVKKFIENNIELINDNNIEGIFNIAAEDLTTHEISQLVGILEDIDIDTEAVRWEVFDALVVEYINDHLNNKYDRSNSWARVEYMLDEISNLGFGWNEAKEHVINNENKYHTTIRELEPEYGWYGSGDYAFEWFNKDAFRKEYLD